MINSEKPVNITGLTVGTKVTIRFKQVNSNSSPALLASATPFYGVNNNVQKLRFTNIGGNYYREAELTGEYLKKDTKAHFAIICDNEIKLYTNSSSYKPELYIEYLSEEESLSEQKYVEGTAGRALNYAINVRSGRPIFTKRITRQNRLYVSGQRVTSFCVNA